MLWAAVADCSPLSHNSIIFIHLFLFLFVTVFSIVTFALSLSFVQSCADVFTDTAQRTGLMQKQS
jgi:hypothetical protein